MNARIKELYLRAHLVREYPEDDPVHGGNPPTVYWGGEKSAEKFAELIVLECAAYVKNSNCFTFASQSDLCAERLKERFGVK
jgi:hypothetical protein